MNADPPVSHKQQTYILENPSHLFWFHNAGMLYRMEQLYAGLLGSVWTDKGDVEARLHFGAFAVDGWDYLVMLTWRVLAGQTCLTCLYWEWIWRPLSAGFYLAVWCLLICFLFLSVFPTHTHTHAHACCCCFAVVFVCTSQTLSVWSSLLDNSMNSMSGKACCHIKLG